MADEGASTISWLVPIVLVVTAVLSIIILRRATSGKLRHIPGPIHTRITHLALKWAILTGRRMYFIDGLHRKYGPVVRVTPTWVSVNDVESVKQIYALVGGFDKAEWYASLNPMPKSGLFTILDNKEAGQRRRLLAAPLSNSAMHRNWETIIRGYVDFAVKQIQAEAKTTGKADILRWWTLMANDVACHVLFGDKLGQLEIGKKTDYVNTMETTLMAAAITSELPLILTIARRLPFKTIFNALDDYVTYAGRAVKNARAGGTKANVFTGILKKVGEGQDELDELTVMVDAGNMLVAASDTTAITMTYLVWCVMKNPEIRSKLEAEVRALPATFSHVDLDKLPWVNAVIDETLRLYGGASSGLPRAVPEGGCVVNGFSLPSGTTVYAQAYSMHRKADLFENPLTFDPTRFIRGLTDDQKIALGAWGRGSRSCIGIHMAKMMLRLSVATFFRLGADDAEGRLRLAPSVTDKSMMQEDFFSTPPAGHKCEVVME